jgi:hypothetical protein
MESAKLYSLPKLSYGYSDLAPHMSRALLLMRSVIVSFFLNSCI